MKRRSVLRRTVALAPLGLAGCLGDDGGATPTGSPTPGVDATSIETTDTGCAEGEDEVPSLAADADGHEVTITGTVRASTPCHLAELVAIDFADGTLSTTVGVTPDDRDGCVECVGAVAYHATIRLATGGETEVVVSHDSHSETTEVLRETVQL